RWTLIPMPTASSEQAASKSTRRLGAPGSKDGDGSVCVVDMRRVPAVVVVTPPPRGGSMTPRTSRLARKTASMRASIRASLRPRSGLAPSGAASLRVGRPRSEWGGLARPPAWAPSFARRAACGRPAGRPMHPDTDASILPRPPADHPLVAKANEVFEHTSPYEGVGLRNHCRRLFHLTSLLMAKRGVEFDPALAYFIAMIHDLGLVSEQDEGINYLRRSLALFHRETRGLPLPEVDPEVVEQCIVYNHRVLPVPGLCDAAECFRNAVMIEHS